MKQNQKLIIDISIELLEKVDDYRFDNRIKSRAEAVRQLLEKTLSATKTTKPAKKEAP